MRQCTKLILLLFCCVGIFSCTRKGSIDQIEVDFEFIRLDRELSDAQGSTAEICNDLSQRYPGVFPVYSSRILGMNCSNPGEIEQFLGDTFINLLYIEVEKIFTETSELERELHSAYQHMRHYFPDYNLPDVYTMVSGTRFPGLF